MSTKEFQNKFDSELNNPGKVVRVIKTANVRATGVGAEDSDSLYEVGMPVITYNGIDENGQPVKEISQWNDGTAVQLKEDAVVYSQDYPILDENGEALMGDYNEAGEFIPNPNGSVALYNVWTSNVEHAEKNYGITPTTKTQVVSKLDLIKNVEDLEQYSAYAVILKSGTVITSDGKDFNFNAKDAAVIDSNDDEMTIKGIERTIFDATYTSFETMKKKIEKGQTTGAQPK